MSDSKATPVLSQFPAEAVLSHVGENGLPRMVDISHKDVTVRVARARSVVRFPSDVFAQLRAQGFTSKKGAILQTAIVAGTMAAKRTSDLIPFCHSLALEDCQLAILPSHESPELVIDCLVRVTAKTGVEMEALTGASVAALVVYDMTKALSHDIVITETRLVEKTGGRSSISKEQPDTTQGIPPLLGLVLAGGDSMRMGEDKTQLRYHGRAQWEHAVALVSTVCTEVHLSCRASQKERFQGARTLSDSVEAQGPIAGLLSAMSARPDAAWLVVACDMPLLTSAALAQLAAERDVTKCATALRAHDSDLPEPLCAIWEPGSAPVLRAFLARGVTCPRKVLLNSDARLVTLGDATPLANANTPEDARRMFARLSSHRPSAGPETPP